MTEKKPRRAHHSYTDEFKQQLVLLYQNGKRKCDICREYDIAVTVFKARTCFHKWMREIDIVDYLLNLDSSFKETYYLYQSILDALKNRDIPAFKAATINPPPSISEPMKVSIKTLRENETYICHSLRYK